ncbi:MAG: hypothetical protein KDA17_06295, partial [Candidatus Saccharibacteria bacterium]|nr:hypothetical protein [Candidatus Saccharibacteria bacterium]
MDSKKTFDNEDSMNVLFDALLSGSTGDAIMAQEARGQSKMVNSAVLPREVGYGQDAKAIYESLGIEV